MPHSADLKSYNISMPKWTVYLAVLIFVFVIGSSIIYSATMTRKLFSYDFLKEKTLQQKDELNKIGSKTIEMQQQINTLTLKENDLRKTLGIKPTQNPILPKISMPEIHLSVDMDSIKKQFQNIDQKIKNRNRSLDSLWEGIQNYKARFAVTPSIWPVNGEVTSGFGYRSFPWNGYHTGVDVTTFFGTPIKATASGVVSLADWKNGYGLTVIIDHGYGLSTMYGHTSKILVNQGQRVEKGQIIALVGSTGFSTGAHVHYEVRKNDVAINPTKYLDVDFLSAGKIWE